MDQWTSDLLPLCRLGSESRANADCPQLVMLILQSPGILESKKSKNMSDASTTVSRHVSLQQLPHLTLPSLPSLPSTLSTLSKFVLAAAKS